MDNSLQSIESLITRRVFRKWYYSYLHRGNHKNWLPIATPLARKFATGRQQLRYCC